MVYVIYKQLIEHFILVCSSFNRLAGLQGARPYWIFVIFRSTKLSIINCVYVNLKVYLLCISHYYSVNQLLNIIRYSS